MEIRARSYRQVTSLGEFGANHHLLSHAGLDALAGTTADSKQQTAVSS